MWHPSIRDEREWRQREEMRGKISVTRAKNGVFALTKIKKMDQLGPKIDEISLKIVLLFQKYRFFY